MSRPEIIVYRSNDKYQDIYVSTDGGVECFDPEDLDFNKVRWSLVSGLNLVEVWRSGDKS